MQFLEPDDQARVDAAMKEVGTDESGTKLLVLNAPKAQKLGFWMIICTSLNRSIGSGIFVTPAILLKATASPAASLLLWALGGFTGMCALLVWLEFGLSIPKFELPNRNSDDTLAHGESLQCVPRSGGEKNFLEYVWSATKSGKMRATCMYAVIYVTLGNLSGNTIAFGQYALQAAGIDNEGQDPLVRGLAVVCMTAACLVHAVYRQGGIYVIVGMALFKVCILLAIIGIGFAAMGGQTFGYGPVQGQTIEHWNGPQTGPSNFEPAVSFAFAKKDFATYANAILFVVYTFSGNEQPFYVLSEVVQPKKIFAKATISATAIITILFMLVNIAYLGVVSYSPDLTIQCLSIKDSVERSKLIQSTNGTYYTSLISQVENSCKLDMATVFFTAVFGGEIAPRVMSGIIAASIFGNVAAMTFLASRVKQEIAKEGILPFSLFFARNTITPWGYLRSRWTRSRHYDPERSPTPALILHWAFSMVLIGATSGKPAIVAYQILVSLYSYIIVVLIGFFTASGLLYARYFCEEGKWVERSGFRPIGGPTAAVIYSAVCLFLLIAAFVPPADGSPFITGVKWFIIPTVGLGFLPLGYLYYIWLQKIVPKCFKGGKILVTDREAVIIREGGEYVQYLEIVDAAWEARSDSADDKFSGLPVFKLLE